MSLSEAEILRYSRQILLRQVGGDGQERLKAARVLVAGAGGLGSTAALYLAAAGVGTVGVCDDDAVDLTNLHRQVIHSTADLGRSKVSSADERLRALNLSFREVEVRPDPRCPACGEAKYRRPLGDGLSDETNSNSGGESGLRRYCSAHQTAGGEFGL